MLPNYDKEKMLRGEGFSAGGLSVEGQLAKGVDTPGMSYYKGPN